MILTYITRILETKWVLPVLIGLGFSLFYASFVPHQPVGLHLSDSLITQAYQLGVVDSPGYPLLTYLLFIVTQTVGRWWNVAAAAHVTSSVLAAISLVSVYQICQLFYKHYHLKYRAVVYNHSITSSLLSLWVVMAVAASHLFWRYSLFAHQYMVSVALFSVAVYLGIYLLIEKPKNQLTCFFWLAIILGLGISHQWIFVPIMLVMVYLLWHQLSLLTLANKIQLIGLLIICSLLPFGLLLIYVTHQVEFSYLFRPDLAGLQTYLQEGYLGDGQAIANNLNDLVNQVNLDNLLNNLWQIGKYLFLSFGGQIVVFLVAGVLFTHPPKKSNSLFSLTVLAAALALSLAAVFSWLEDSSNLPHIIPQLLLLSPLIGLMSWFGLYEIVTRLSAAASTLTQNNYVYLGASVLLLVSMLIPFKLRAQAVTLTDKLATAQVSHKVLSEVESDAIVACFTYASCHGLIYQQQVNQINPDAIILPFYYLPDRMVYSHADLQGFDYGTYPMVMYDIITWNRELRPIYSVDMFDQYFSLFGIDYGFLFYVPLGYYGQLTNQIPPTLPETNLEITDTLLGTDVPAWDKALEEAKLDIIKRHLFNTSIYLKSGLRSRGVNEVNLATTLGYDLDPQAAKEIADLRASIESILPTQFYQLDQDSQQVSYILEQVDELEENRRYNRATYVAQGAVTLDPRHVEARLRWANLLEIVEASQSAVIEYENVLKLDPENETATERLDYQQALGN